jgi:hypothetical protein
LPGPGRRPGERVRVEPFEAIEIEVATLFGADPTDAE